MADTVDSSRAARPNGSETARPGSHTITMPISLGCDRLFDSDRLAGKRIGLVANPASVDASFRHIADRIMEHPGARLTALFGPQHGFHSDVQDNMIETGDAQDETRRVPIFSLYSDTREPLERMLAEVDMVVIDLQDVGTRVYTFISTMANCLRACRALGRPVLVCDRPNPIGGEAVEGPVLQADYASFVGQFPIPLRHGMTIGELAWLFNEHFGIGAQLEVLPMAGWRRTIYHDQTGLPWVMPSPNIPTLDTAIVYPGAVLFEGTMLSEGRGTTRPFEMIGAPWVNAAACAARANEAALPGVHFRPVVFEPTFHKHAHLACGGCQIHVTDRSAFRPIEAAVTLMVELRREATDRFAWREPPYEYEHTKQPIDILAGSADLRTQIEADTPTTTITRSWQRALDEFLDVRRRHLLYA